MQTTSKILMVRPFHFFFNEETAKNNYFQQRAPHSIHEKAAEEFDSFVKLLRSNDIDVIVVQDTPEPSTPDSIFPNNWFSSHISGELILYPMFAQNRRQERKPEILNLLTRKMNHPKIIDLTPWEKENEFLEGTGSMIFDRYKRVAYACRSERTSERVLADFCSRMNYDYVLFDAFDRNKKPIYHTNVMMEVGTQVAVVCLDAIQNEHDREKLISRLQSSGKIVVEIGLDQLDYFVGNMLELKNRSGQPIMVMSKSAREALSFEQEKTISTYNKIISADLKTIETAGGGSARCMIAEIFS